MKKLVHIGLGLIMMQLFWLPSKVSAQKYCYPTFKYDCSQQYITEFQLGAYDNTPGCQGSYGIDTQYTKSSVVSVYRGKSYLFRLKGSTSASGVEALYFDANRDGDFNDAGETVGTENNGTIDSLRTYLNVPLFAKVGTTRARAIVMDANSKYLTVGSGCGDFSATAGSGYGQSEDYLVTVTAFKTDAYLIGLADPQNYGCANTSQYIKVIVRNFGTDTLKSIPITVVVTPVGGTATTINYTFTGKLAPDQTDTFTTTSYANMGKAQDYNIVAYSKMSGDQDRTNDTVKVSYSINPKVSDPSVTNLNMCGYNKTTFAITTNTKGAVSYWYNAKTKDSIINSGDYYTPRDTLKKDTTFYVQSELINKGSLETIIYTLDRGNNGVYIDINAKTTVTIDSFIAQYDAGTYSAEVLYRQGSYQGFESTDTTGANWKVLGTSSFTSSGTGHGTNVPVGGVTIPGGQTYGFEIIIGSANYRYTVGTTYLHNNDLSIYGATTSAVTPGSNTNLTTGRTFDGGVYYHVNGCTSALIPISAKVRQGIPGVAFKKSAPFQGFFNGGSSFSPDDVCPRDTLTYELTPPYNMTNADYGKKWVISHVALVTAGKDTLKDTMTIYPKGSSNFKIRVVPPVNYADSSVFVLITAFSPSDSCVLNLSRQIDVSSLPKANFGFNEVCVGKETTFFDSTDRKGNTVYYTWDFGDGGSGTQSYPTHTYAGAGTYDVTLKVTTAAGCYDAITKKVTVYGPPKLGFATSALCVNEKVTFMDTTHLSGATVTKYYWELAQSPLVKSFSASPVNTYSKAGVYPIKMAVTLSTGCVDTIVRNIVIVNKPSPSFDFKGGCVGDTSYFTNTTAGDSTTTYAWDFGDFTYSTDKNPSKVYNLAGAYAVSLTVKQGTSGCTASFTKTVSPYDFPKAGFSYQTACAGSPLKFLDTSKNDVARFWIFGTGASDTSSQLNPQHIYSKAGTYPVKLIAKSTGGCIDSTTRTVVVTDVPKADFSSNSACLGDPVTFTNNSTAPGGSPVYEWDFGDGSSKSTDVNPQHAYSKAGQYLVILTVKSGICSDVHSGNITVNPNPTPSWTFNKSGKKVDFSPSNKSYKSYHWDYGDGNSDTSVSPTHFYSSATDSYSVTLTVTDNNGCSGESTKEVKTNSIFEPNANLWDVKVYPNPFTGATTVSYTLEKRCPVKVSVMDLEGREVMLVLPDTKQEAGKHDLAIDGSKLSSGVYILRVVIGDKCYNTRITQMK